MTNDPASGTARGMNDTPHNRLMAAIGILQCYHMATDSNLEKDAIYGTLYMPDQALEQAIKILSGLLGDVEKLGGRAG